MKNSEKIPKTTADFLIEDPFSGFPGEDKLKAHPKKFKKKKNSKKKFQIKIPKKFQKTKFQKLAWWMRA